MELIIIFTILFYMLSTAAYFSYLFLQKNYLHRSGFCLLGVGFVCHSVFIGYEFATSGLLPVHNLHETLLLVGWTIAGVFLMVQYKFNLKVLGIYAAPLATLVIVISSQLPREPSQVKNIFNSFWLILHVMIIFIGEASFALACGAGVLYLIQENAIKTKIMVFFQTSSFAGAD